MIGKSDSYVYTFDNKKLQQKDLLGSKGMAFSKIADLGIQTPETFIITTLAFDDFLLSNNLVDPILKILQEVRPFVRQSAEDASGKIFNLINNGKIPRVIGESIQSVYKSISKNSTIFLNLEASHVINGRFIPDRQQEKIYISRGFDDLIKNLKLGWMSLFTPEAIEQRTNLYYDGPLSIAFKVSKNLRGEISGLAYSVPPITKEADQMEIYAMYGVKTEDLDLESNSDSYRININTKKIVEKNIIPQDYMYIKTGSVSDKNELQMVEISKEWKKRQKIEDSRIMEIFDSAYRVENTLQVPIEMTWVIEAGNLFVTDIKKFDVEVKGDPLATLDEKSFLKDFNDKKANDAAEEDEESKSEKDLKKLEIEINEMIQEENKIVKASKRDLDPELLELSNPRTNKLFKPWSQKYSLVTDIILDVTSLSSASLSSLNLFNGGFFDGTDLILSSGELPEKSLKTVNESIELMSKFATDITLTSKNLENKPMIYQFSKINAFEYKLLNLNPKNYEYFGDERFIDNPKALQFEVRALKLAKEEYDVSNLSISFPYIRSVSNLKDLKSIVSAEGLKRSTNMKFYAEVSVPSFAHDVENIPDDLIDGLIIDYVTLLKLSVYRETIRKGDHEVVLRLIKEIIKIGKAKKFEILIKLDDLEPEVIMELIDLQPHSVIFNYVPNEELVKQIQVKEQGFLKDGQKSSLHTKFRI